MTEPAGPLTRAIRSAQGVEVGPAPVAMCRRCTNQPLVSTFAWRGFEFYCIRCGGLYGFLDPRPASPTPELLELLAGVEAEWKRLSDGIVPEGRATPATEEADHLARDRISAAVSA